MIDRLESEGRLATAALTRVYEDVALLVQTLTRLLGNKGMTDRPGIQAAAFHLLQSYLSLALEALNDREREVLVMRFGLADGKGIATR